MTLTINLVKTCLRYSRCCVAPTSILHSCRYLQVIKYQNVSRSPNNSSYFANVRLGVGGDLLLSTLTTNTMAEVSSSSSDLVVHHDPESSMFFITLVGESEKAVLEYETIGADTVNLYHTGVPVSQRGKGIAKVIAKAALDHFASQNTKMKLTCTYLQKYIRENPLPLYKDKILEL